MTLKVLDLFSGIGGFSLGLERAGFQTVAFCEIDPFCRSVLAKHWPDVPIFEDVTVLRGEDVGPVDVICGGYPCQPFSLAGERKGTEDDRHLWPEFMRLVAELGPTWVIGENVAGHISMGLDAVLSDLETEGYAVRSFVIPAVSLDAKHRRDRVWTIGHANGNSQPNGAIDEQAQKLQAVANACGGRCDRAEEGESKQPRGAEAECSSEALADANSYRSQRGNVTGKGQQKRSGKSKRQKVAGSIDGCRSDPCWWLPEPNVGRVAHGVPNRVDRLKALGNAVVPQIPEILGKAILTVEANI